MDPYTTTIENILPGMIVRATDVEEGGTAVVGVIYTYTYEDGTAVIGGDMLSVDVKHDSEITVLHDPTQSGQDVQMSVEMLSDEKITSAIRRSVEQVMAYHKGRPPQQYNTGGLDLPLNPYAL